MLSKILNETSNYFDAILYKVLIFAGAAGVGGNVVNGVASNTYTERLLQPTSIQDICAIIAAIVGIFGGLVIILERCVNIWLSIRKNKRIEEQADKLSNDISEIKSKLDDKG